MSARIKADALTPAQRAAIASGVGLPHGGLAPAQPRKRRRQKADPAAFVRLCVAHGLPAPVAELRFAPPRRWRFDWAWPASDGVGGVALEVQGGLFVRGRHSRGAALLKEHEKLNAAAALGWRLLFTIPKDVASGAILADVVKALEA